jgi:beta-glucosidase
MPFPPGFAWGAATSAYQIEGAVDEDGRGPSIWDTFSHTPGMTADGATGDVACDHYHRWADDVDLISSYGLNAYRFSVAWTRIQPTGRGQANQRGIDFYRRLVDRLVAKGIAPIATLYHCDLPQALQDDGGGWQNRDVTERFAEYAAIVYDGLGDGVAWWLTINEPWVMAAVGHREGRQAPGLRDLRAELRVGHHLLLSHAAAVEAYRASGRRAPIGICHDAYPTFAESETDADRAAAALADAYRNRWYLDPLFHGTYPADLLEHFAGRFPLDWLRDGDVARMRQPMDYLGVNYYSRQVVRAAHAGEASEFPWVRSAIRSPEVERTDVDWEVVPDCLPDLLLRLQADYGPIPLLITENGCAVDDGPSADGEIHDERRVAFMRGHLAALERAIDAGVDVRGYLAWSLMDNYEWAHGYRQRFGITYVDYATQRRIPKDSARWYADFVHRNRATA